MTDARRHPERQYLELLRELLEAPPRQTRNDAATRSVFGRQMRFDIGRDGFPLLTTKKLPLRVIAGELIWFLSGSTNVKPLQAQGIKIWDEWQRADGDLGPVYGQQFRRWVAHPDNPRLDIDQVARTLQGLRDDPHGRRHVMTLWNPADLDKMALPPCHGIAIQFYVGYDERLSLQMYQRSGDAFLGVPFNIASYALLLCMFARVLGRQVGEFVYTLGDCHLYSNHVEQAEQQILRDPKPFPEVTLAARTDMDSWQLGDVTLRNYYSWPHLAGKVSA